MKKLFNFFLFCSLISYGQYSGIGSNPGVGMGSFLPASFNLNFTTGTHTGIYGNGPNYSYEVKFLDSPYTNEEYKSGKTTIHKNPGFSAMMRYNSAKDVIEFLDKANTVKELLRRPYITADFDGNKYVILNYIDEDTNTEKLSYFNPKNSGATKLLFMPKKKLKLINTFFQEKRLGHYDDASVYYIKKEGYPAVKINLNKSSVLYQLDKSYEDTLENFITKNNLNLRNEADVIALLKYYNMLLSTGNDFTKPVQS